MTSEYGVNRSGFFSDSNNNSFDNNSIEGYEDDDLIESPFIPEDDEDDTIDPSESSSSILNSGEVIDFTEDEQAQLARFDEEIGLNEATLESLHAKLKEIQAEIDKEQLKIKLRKANISTLEIREVQLRTSRDENIGLAKSMETTMKKCLAKLRRKLDERSSISSLSVHAVMNDPAAIPLKTSLIENPTEKERLQTESDRIKNSNDNSTETSHVKENDEEKREFNLEKNLPNQNQTHLETSGSVISIPSTPDFREKATTQCRNMQEAVMDVKSEKRDGTSSSLTLKDNCGNHVLMKENIIKVPIQNLFTDHTLLDQIWSQRYPYKDHKLSQQTNELFCKILTHIPLLSPVPSERWLQKMVCITKDEIIANVQARNGFFSKENSSEEEKNDFKSMPFNYMHFMEGTCLDVFSQIKYFPFVEQIAYDKFRSYGTKTTPELKGNERVVKTRSKNHLFDIDPNLVLCPYDLAGVCADDSCTFQHLNKDNNKSNKSSLNISTSEIETENVNDASMKGITPQLPDLNISSISSLVIQNTTINKKKRKAKSNSEYLNDNKSMYPHNYIDNTCNHSVYYNNVFQNKKKLCKDEINSGFEKSNKEIIDSSTSKFISNINTSELQPKRLPDNNCTELKFQDNAPFDEESDFICLPEIYNNIDKNHKVSYESDEDDFLGTSLLSKNIDIHTSETEVTGCEWYLSSEVRKKQNVKNIFFMKLEDIPKLTDLLTYFGFKVITDSNLKDKKEVECMVEEIEEKSFHDGEKEVLQQLIVDLKFLGRLIDAIRLCANAGRYDICLSIIKIGKKFLIDLRKEKDQLCHVLFQKVLDSVKVFADFNFGGFGSSTFFGQYITQTALAILSSFVMVCHEEISSTLSPPLKFSTEPISVAKEFLLQWTSLFEDCYRKLSLISFPYMQPTNSTPESIEPESKSRNFQNEVYIDYKKINFILLAEPKSLEKSFEKLLQSALFGSYIAHSISKAFNRDTDIRSQEFIEKYIVPLVSSMKAVIFQIKRLNLCIRNKYMKRLSRLSFFVLFAPILISQYSVFCILTRNNQIEKEMKDTTCHDMFGLSAYDHGALVAAIKLFKIAMVQMQKIENSYSFSYRLLKVPFLSLLVALTTASGNFSKVQKLLEKNIFLSKMFNTDQSKSSFFKYYGPEYYSEILWSQLLQLRLSLPSRRSFQYSNNGNPETELPGDEMNCVEKKLSALCLHYEIDLWKLFLNGDSNLISNANYFLPNSDERVSNIHHNSIDSLNTRKEKNAVNDIKKICRMIIQTLVNNEVEVEEVGTVTNYEKKEAKMNDIVLRGSCRSSQLMSSFPFSLLLFGKTLRHVQLMNCNLCSIPETIGFTCPNIKVLKISGNKLTRLPDSVGNLSRLIDLDISSNSLISMNINICKLKRLKTLRVSNNKIREIPESLCECENLILIDIRNNEIISFPSNLPLKLGKLSSLLIEGNPFCGANMTS